MQSSFGGSRFRWCPVAWDVDRADWRIFRLDRIERPQPIGVQCAPRELPAEDSAAFVTRVLAHFRPMRRVVFIAHVSAAELIERFRVRAEEVETLDDHSCLRRTGADSLEWTTVRIAHLGVEFEVREPRAMVEMVRDLGRKLLRAAGDAE
ncbi:WYL domain-containing protein [Nocardia sp. NPDC051463]|uniref:WYL domain-containing protein n=1 Tax=Nocardia sp. NPDC051463 TaxID=3154845 RepID=UPI003445E450